MNLIARWFSELKKKERNAPALPVPSVPSGQEEWLRVWRGEPSWKEAAHGHVLPLGGAICHELSRLACSEMRVDAGEGERAAYLKEVLDSFLPRLYAVVAGACGGGSVMLKPYPAGRGIGIDAVLPDRYLVTDEDGEGNPVGCCFFETGSADGKTYLRTEEHGFDGRGVYRVRNRAFAMENGGVGKEVPLKTVKRWAALAPEIAVEGLASPLFSQFSLPDLRGGKKGRAVYADAMGLLRDADLQYDRLLWEFEGGELAVDAGSDAFLPDRDGQPVLPAGKDRLYRVNALDAGYEQGELMKVFSPALRDESLIRGLNRILMFVEDAVGLARGTFSDPCEVARTATEIRAMRQKTHCTVGAIRGRLALALAGLIRAMDGLCSLYGLCAEGKADVTVSFGDGILGTDDEERGQDRLDFEAGLISRGEYRAKWHAKGETE